MDSTKPQNASITITAFRHSEEIHKIASALSKLQGKINHPNRNRTAVVPMKNGGKYSYKYADLVGVLDCCKAFLAEHELSIIQMPSFNNGMVAVTTILAHSSGQYFQSHLSMPTFDSKPQTIGSVITYCRRYALSAMLGISSEEDDDASESKGSKPEKTNTKPALTKSQWADKILIEFAKYDIKAEHVEATIGGPVEQCDKTTAQNLVAILDQVKENPKRAVEFFPSLKVRSNGENKDYL